MLKGDIKTISLENFVRGQAYNLPKFGDSVDVINAKLKQLSDNLIAKGVYLEFEGFLNLCDSVKELVKDSPTYTVKVSYEDANEVATDSAISSFKIEVLKK